MKGSKSAFALVEIVVALGIAAFILTGVIGLLSAACGTGRASIDETLLVSMANRVVSDLRQSDFTALGTGGNRDFYFDADGQWLTTNTNATFYCRAVPTGDTTIDSAGSVQPVTDSAGNVRLVHVRLDFSWPASVVSPPKNTKTIYVDIARR